MRTVYLDNAATTRLDERVLEAMLPYLQENFGNASSIHHAGRKAGVAVEEAREKIATFIGARPSEIIFTSGGTESNNSAIKGVLSATSKKHVVSSKVEHHAVLHPLQHARNEGIQITCLDVMPTGFVTVGQVRKSITDDTALVTLMHVNNEISSVNPLSEIGELCLEHGIPLHSDTVQSIGKIPVNVQEMNINLLSISGHKIHGPKGIGVLYVRSGTRWKPWMEGGSQERRRRGGTLNVPGIVGLGKAIEIAATEMEQNNRHLRILKKKLVDGLRLTFPDMVVFNGDIEHGANHIVNCSFKLNDEKSLDGEMLLLNLDIEGICISNGSACTSGAVEASHVLTALGMVTPTAKSSLRFSLSKFNTEEDIDYTLEKLETIIRRMCQTAEV
jgi:cysteine desulfurase